MPTLIGQTTAISTDTIAVPGGGITDDIILVFTSHSLVAGLITPDGAGWVQISNSPGNGNMGEEWRKQFDGSTSVTFTEANPGDLLEIVCQLWRGLNQQNPLNLNSNSWSSSGTAFADFGGTAIADSLILTFVRCVNSGTVITSPDESPPGYTEAYNGGVHMRVDYQVVAADATGPYVQYGFTPNTASFTDIFSMPADPGPAPVIATAEWELPALQWSAAGVVFAPVVPSLGTFRFDAGIGVEWYLVAPISDSGNELQSKVVKAVRATGKLTNASAMIFGFDVGQPIITEYLEDGTRLPLKMTTRPQVFADSVHVAQTKRKQVNVKNSCLHTVRLSGDDRNQPARDEVHEVVYEVAVEGVRR